jgi:ribose 1,5-bisphosphokinase PhnN
MQSAEFQTEAKANHPSMSWHFHSVTYYTPEGIYSGVDGTLNSTAENPGNVALAK